MNKALGKIAACVFAVSLAGCGQHSTAGIRQLDQAREAYRRGNFVSCECVADSVIRSDPGSSVAGEVHYLRGLSRLKLGRRDAAKSDFTEAWKVAEDVELRTWIAVQLGNLAFDEESYGQSCSYYMRAVATLPARPPSDRVLYQYGVALQRAGRFQSGRVQLGELLLSYPQSPYAKAARRKLGWGRDYFSVQCGAFSAANSARRAVLHLKESGFDGRILREGETGRYLVMVGKAGTYEQAREILNQLHGIHHDAFVVP